MNAFRTVALDLPAYWASALINGDDSGLEPEELTQLKGCLARHGVFFSQCLRASDDSFFMLDHDARRDGAPPADCLTYTFSAVRR